jgi:tRNA pseudouridine-54 N-methylase
MNIESTSSKPLQNAKPFSKALKKNLGKKKEENNASKPIVFVSTEASTSVKPSSHTDQKSVLTLKGESSEPISRWVPKSNQ